MLLNPYAVLEEGCLVSYCGLLQACKKAVLYAKKIFPIGENPDFLLLPCNDFCIEAYADNGMTAKRVLRAVPESL